MTDRIRENYEIRLSDERVIAAQTGHCSDCYSYSDPLDPKRGKKIKSLIGQENWRGGSGSFAQILSPDGETDGHKIGDASAVFRECRIIRRGHDRWTR